MLNYFSRLLCRFPNFKTIPTAFLDSLSYEDQVQYLSAAILNLAEKIDEASVPQSLLDEVAALKVSVSTLSDRVGNVSEKVDTQGEQLNTLSESVQSVSEKVATQGEQVSDLSEKTDAQVEQISLLNNKIIALEARVSALEQQPGATDPLAVHTTEASAIIPTAELTEAEIPAVYSDSFSPIEI